MSAKWLPVVVLLVWLSRWLHAVPVAHVHVYVGVVVTFNTLLTLLWDCSVGVACMCMTVFLYPCMLVVVVVRLSRRVLRVHNVAYFVVRPALVGPPAVDHGGYCVHGMPAAGRPAVHVIAVLS